jgi:hypothetical protein
MAQETIDFGAYPNDPDSDAIRVAFQKTQNNFNELFSIQYQTGVSQLIEGAGISVNQNTGNVTVTNRIANITIQTDANLRIGVTTATSNTATINSGTTPFVLNLSNSISTGNITATGSIRGVIAATSNSQPNITTVGNLANLSVVGTIRSNSFVSNNVDALNFSATYMASPGSNNQILLNNLGNIDATSNLTFTGNLLTVTGAISATGNITGQNFINTGNISANGIISSNANITTTASISATGNITANNFFGRLANGTSNIRIPTANGVINFSSAGNANIVVISGLGSNVNGFLNVTGNADVDNLSTANISATGNANVGNVNTSAISASGNVTGSNFLTSGLISATGNVTGNNVISATDISAIGNASAANLLTTGIVSAIGNVISLNLSTGIVSATGNVQASNLRTTGSVSSTGNVQAGNLRTNGLISATGNLTANTANLGNSVTANFFIGSGNNLSNIQGLNVLGAVEEANVSYFANVTATNNANAVNYITFVNTTSGNASFVTDTDLTYNPNSGVFTSGALSVVANIAAGNIILTGGANTANSFIRTRNITTGANTTTGNITGNWALTTGSLLTATYADLAEFYAADQKIEPGTVVKFGGDYEITICDEQNSTKIAGVVSTEPAYVMNSMLKNGSPTMIALQGRVPVKVTGKIEKGDMLVSAGNGCAMANPSPIVGSVLGKSLENFDGEYGIIEVAVGRL